MAAPKIPGYDFDGLAEATAVFFGDAETVGTPVSATNPLPVTSSPAAGTTTYVDNAAGQTVDVTVIGTVAIDNAAGQTVDVATPAGAALTTTGAALPAGTSRSGTIAAANTSQTLAAVNAARKSLRLQNISAADLGVNELGTAAAIGTAGTNTVPPGAYWEARTSNAVAIIGGTLGQAFTAIET